MFRVTNAMSLEAPLLGSIQNQIILFNTFIIVGLILTILVLIPALFSPNVLRTKAWFGQVIPWVVYSISYLLLVGHQTGPEPPFGLCLFQAALIYAVPTLIALSATCFLIDFYFVLANALFKSTRNPRLTIYLLILPPSVYVAVFIEALLLVNDPSTVERDPSHLYCHLTTKAQPLISAVVVIAATAVLAPLKIWIGILLFRNWATFGRFSGNNPRFSLSIFVRMAFFGTIAMLVLGLGVFLFFSVDTARISSLTLCILPVVAAITFGSQMDILRTWMFWKKVAPPSASQGRQTESNTFAV